MGLVPNPSGLADQPAVLAGRDAEVARIDEAVERAARGRGTLLLIEGEAGIGKTSLLAEGLRRAAAAGFQCRSGSAAELERHRPFGAVAEALGMPPLPDPGAAGEADAVTGPPEAEFAIVDALIERVAELSDGGPVAIGLDDLQWADPSSLLVLHRLGRSLPDLPVVLAASLRPLPRSPDLQAVLVSLRASGQVVDLPLGRLHAEAVADLIARLLGARPGPALLRQLARAGGNPFFATELVANLAREGAIRIAGDGDLRTAEVSSTGVSALEGDAPFMPSSLTATILRRLEYLTPEVLETLQVASILGSRFSVVDLATAVGEPAAALAPIITETAQAGLLGEAGQELAFRHDLIREALYGSMSPTLRSWWHLAVASLLEAAGRSRADVAEHVVRGALPGDPEAAEWLRVAARQAAAQSPSVAVELLTRALELAPRSDPHRATVCADLAVYALRSERPAEAEAICRALLAEDRTTPMEAALRARARTYLIEAMIRQGRVAEARAEVEAALEAPGADAPRVEHLLTWRATCQAATWDLVGATESGHRALALAERAANEAAAGGALGILAVAHHLQGDFAEALRHGREALERIARGVGAARQPAQPVLNLARFLIDDDRPAEAGGAIDAWRRSRRHEAAGSNYAVERALRGEAAFWAGDWDVAAAELDASLHVARTAGTRRGTSLAHSLLALIAVHRDDLAGAQRHVSAAQENAESGGLQWRPNRLLWAGALLAEAQGRSAQALDALRSAWTMCRAAGIAVEYPVIGPDLVRVAVQARNLQLAHEVTTAVETLASSAAVASVQGAAARCCGLLNNSATSFLEAVEAYRASGRRRELGLACEDAAASLLASGRRAEAQPLAEEALRIFRRIGASRDASRAEDRLRGTSTQEEPSGRAEALTAPGWDTLTPAERTVARHMAAGRTNPEIAQLQGISVRTVQTHASRVLDKLRVPRRAGLARLLAGGAPGGSPGLGAAGGPGVP